MDMIHALTGIIVKAFLKDEKNDKIIMITSLDREMRLQLGNVSSHIYWMYFDAKY